MLRKLRGFHKIKRSYMGFLYSVGAILVILAMPLSAYAAPTFNNFPITSTYNPGQLTTAGGALWYNESSTTYPNPNHYIAKMTTAGIVTDYDIGYPSGATDFVVSSITTGSDGNVWFNGISGNSVYTGYLDISTGLVTFYAVPMQSYGGLGNIVAASDGNLWYAVKSAWAQNYSYFVYTNPTTGTSAIGRTLDSYAVVSGLANGSDGRLWYTDSYYNRVTAFNVTGTSNVNSYIIPGASSYYYPGNIAAGPDGALWFSESPTGSTSGTVIKLTTNGSFTQYTLPTGMYGGNFVAGPDGALWFSYGNNSNRQIGRVTPSGIVTGYSIPSATAGAYSLALGPDGNIWFSYKDSTGAKLGSITTAPTFTTYSTSSSYTLGQMITTGGNLWYIEASTTYPNPNNYIAKRTMSGVVTDYSLGLPAGATSFSLRSIAASPDGNIWFNGFTGGGSVYTGYLNTTTGTTTFYGGPVPGGVGSLVLGSDGNFWYSVKSSWAQNYTYFVFVNPSDGSSAIGRTLDAYANVSSATSGPDGRIWYTDQYYNRVVSFTISGTPASNSYSIPGTTSYNYPAGIMTGPDGNLWFTATISSNNTAFRVTTSGSFTSYTFPTGTIGGGFVNGIDGALWFTSGTNTSPKVGRLTTSGGFSFYTPTLTGVTTRGSVIKGPDDAFWFTYRDSSGGHLARLGY